MDKQQATNLIKDIFESAFNEGQYLRFLRELFNGQIDESDDRKFDFYGQYIHDSFKNSVRRYKRLGTYTDPNGHEIDLLVVILKRDSALDRARTMQRNFAAYHLKQRQKETAIIAYTTEDRGDWRFSMVRSTATVSFEGDKLKVKDELTPVRRYSFLVGKSERSHTAQRQLFPILTEDKRDPTLADLEKAFSIEAVTDEFFDKYKGLFLQLKEELDRLTVQNPYVQTEFNQKGLETANFAKKLLGQIVFLYFLQKKGWLGVRQGENWGTGSKNFLSDLFKQTSPQQNFFNDVLEPLFYEALAIERRDNVYTRLNVKIPFLNGGLFEPVGNYNWRNIDMLIDNSVFKSIFDTFDLYNFTVREDEPLEKEVAVDPEMLGKVFENLLEVDDRKSKGAFYTPREIVHYMCQESLINYLDTLVNTRMRSILEDDQTQPKLFELPPEKGEQLSLSETVYHSAISREDITTFIRFGELAVQNDLAKELGSKSYRYQMPESIRTHAARLDEALANIKICDPAIGSGAFPVGMMQEIIKAREVLTIYLDTSDDRTTYHFKRHAIQESIYGVDIDPGAIEIAKLRLWLSLVVDENDYQHIKPLPNLDYKIVCGNSLLNVQKDLFNLELFHKLEKLKTAYFDQTNPSKKQEQRTEIDAIITQLTGGNTRFDFEIYFSEVFHPYNNRGRGFDIVIGNPPYVVSNDKILRDLYKESVFGRPNLYGFFLHRSLETLLSKSGVLIFINPRTLLTDAYFKGLRKFILKHGNVQLILNIVDRRNVFASVLQSTIVNMISSNGTNDTVRIKNISTKEEIFNTNEITINKKEFLFGPPDDPIFIVAQSQNSYSIFRSLSKFKSFSQNGLSFTTGKIQWDLYKDVLSPTPSSSAIRLIWAENIQRYYFADTRLRKDRVFINGVLEKATPIREKTIVVQRTTAIEQPHRIIAMVVDPNDFGYPILAENNTSYLVTNTQNISLNFALALLNSKLMDYIFRHINSNTHVSGGELNSLPFAVPSDPKLTPILSRLVDYIKHVKKSVDIKSSPHARDAVMASYFEQIVDALVYELYFPEELHSQDRYFLRLLQYENLPVLDQSQDNEIRILRQTFERLFETNHPLRQNLFFLDNISIIRTIEGKE